MNLVLKKLLNSISEYFDLSNKKLKLFLESRQRLSKKAFINKAYKLGFPKIVIECVYEEVVKYLSFIGNPNIYMEDDFVEDYNFIWEDFELLVEAVFKSLKMDYPSEQEIKLFIKHKKNSLGRNRIIDIIEAVEFYRKLRQQACD